MVAQQDWCNNRALQHKMQATFGMFLLSSVPVTAIKSLLKLVAWTQEHNQITHTKSNVKQYTECALTCHCVTFDSNAPRTLCIGKLATKMMCDNLNSTTSNSIKTGCKN